MDKQNLSAYLQRLHLSPNEANVYLALSELGQTSAGDIIKSTGLHRSVVYNSLDKLIDRKLVFKVIKKNISFYQPTDPDRFIDNVMAEKEIAEALVPDLKQLISGNPSELTIYEGLESYRHFWIESMKRMPAGSTDCVAGSIAEKFGDLMGSDMAKYSEIQQNKKIQWKMIVFRKSDFEMKLSHQFPDLYQYRLISRPSDTLGNFNILGEDSVVLHSTSEPMVIEVKNKTLVKVFQNIFDIMWESGSEISDGSNFLPH